MLKTAIVKYSSDNSIAIFINYILMIQLVMVEIIIIIIITNFLFSNSQFILN